MENKTMLIDFYEFTMGQTYLIKMILIRKFTLMYSSEKILLMGAIQFLVV